MSVFFENIKPASLIETFVRLLCIPIGPYLIWSNQKNVIVFNHIMQPGPFTRGPQESFIHFIILTWLSQNYLFCSHYITHDWMQCKATAGHVKCIFFQKINWCVVLLSTALDQRSALCTSSWSPGRDHGTTELKTDRNLKTYIYCSARIAVFSTSGYWVRLSENAIAIKIIMKQKCLF